MAVNVYDELKNALTQVKNNLDEGVAVIKPAVKTLAGAVPQINDLLAKLVGLLDQLKVEINKLDASAIPVDKVLPFIDGVKSLLDTSRNILPADQGSNIDTALEVVTVIKSIPTPEQIKAEVIGLLDAVKNHIASLRA